MGMPQALGMDADFSGMDGTKDLFISGVFHKAWGEVNEEGTEAAAATAVVMEMKAVVARSPVFLADHPFIFFICDTRSGSVLFLGRLADPSRWPQAPGPPGLPTQRHPRPLPLGAITPLALPEHL
jgi:serpin B